MFPVQEVGQKSRIFLVAHRQGYRVTTLHIGNGFVSLEAFLRAAEF